MKAKIRASFLVGIFVIGMTLGTFFLPKQSYSASENRALASFPKISLSTISSGEFSSSFDTWFSDHFAGRDTWTAVNGETEYLLGKRENEEVFLCNNQLMARLKAPNEGFVEGNISALSSFYKKNTTPAFYVMLVPSASEIQVDRLPKNAKNTLWSQKEAIDQWYKELGDAGWTTVDVAGALADHNEEEIYYRTDHHWTSLGAYYGYEELAKTIGMDITPKEDMVIETASTDFYGTLYSKAGFREVSPDTIEYYFPNGVEGVESVTINDTEYDSLYFRENLEAKDQYASFLGENRSYVSVKTTANTGKKILMIKDSYANSLIPFLTSSYDEIDLVDFRYINETFTDHFSPDDYSDIVVLYSVDTFSSGNDLSKIDW